MLPADPDHRDLLGQLLCFAGQWERADKHFEILGSQFPDRSPVVALIRHLIRAAGDREQFYEEGRCRNSSRVRPSTSSVICRRRSVCVRESRPGPRGCSPKPNRRGPGSAAAATPPPSAISATLMTLPPRSSRRSPPPGNTIGFPSSASVAPCCTPSKRLWTFSGDGVRSTLWTVPAASCICQSSTRGRRAAEDDALRLGRCTEWLGGDGEPARGIGHRILSIDGNPLPLVQVASLEFDAVPKPA